MCIKYDSETKVRSNLKSVERGTSYSTDLFQSWNNLQHQVHTYVHIPMYYIHIYIMYSMYCASITYFVYCTFVSSNIWTVCIVCSMWAVYAGLGVDY